MRVLSLVTLASIMAALFGEELLDTNTATALETLPASLGFTHRASTPASLQFHPSGLNSIPECSSGLSVLLPHVQYIPTYA